MENRFGELVEACVVEAYLGDFAKEYDIDGIIRDGSHVADDGNRYWNEEYDDGDEFERLVSIHELEPVVEARLEWEANGEGLYKIGWSDGGMDWTSNGPVYFDDLEELQDEVIAALEDATDTHIPCVEFVGDKLQQKDDLTEYMVEHGFGDYSNAGHEARTDMEDAALEFAAREQASNLFSELGEAMMRQRYHDGTATAGDVRTLQGMGAISDEEAVAYYGDHGWDLPKFGLRND